MDKIVAAKLAGVVVATVVVNVAARVAIISLTDKLFKN